MQLDDLNKEIAALNPGEVLIKKGVPEDIYHASEGEGSTAMREATKSMAHYRYYKDSERIRTQDMVIGSAIHTLVLEPDLFFDRFVIAPDHLKPGNNKAWIEWKAAQTLPILTKREMATVDATASSVMDRALPYFSDGVAEKSYWRKDSSGLILKARIDYEIGDLGIDLKSAKEETPHKFLNKIRYDYNIQDALYRRVTGLSDFIFIGACKQPPHAIYAARQCEKKRAEANDLISAAIQDILIAKEFNEYPLPPIEILETE